MVDAVTVAAAISATRLLVKSARGIADIAQGMDQLFAAQEDQKKAEETGKPKSRTQQVVAIRSGEGDAAYDDETSLGSVAADVLEKEQIARNLKALEREIDAKWGKSTFKKIQLEQSKRRAHRVKVQREKKEEQMRKAEAEKSFWVKFGLETLKAIFLIAFVGGGIYLLIELKAGQ
jgi:hypothetical protein